LAPFSSGLEMTAWFTGACEPTLIMERQDRFANNIGAVISSENWPVLALTWGFQIAVQ
jgi:hypothetical protein